MPTAAAPPWEAVVEGGTDSPSLAVRGRDGVGHPLVLLHGLGGTLEEWEPVAALLAPRHPLYAYDLRGHGRSGDGDWTVEGHAADLARVVARFGLRAPVVAGYGLGGVVAALFATRRPDLTAAVGIDGYCWPRAAVVAEHLGLDAAQAAATTAAARAFVVDQMVAAYSPMPAEAFDRLLASYRTGASGIPGSVVEATALRGSVREDRLISLRPSPRAVRATAADLAAYDTDALAADLRSPTLAVLARGAFPPMPGAPALLPEIVAAQVAHELAAAFPNRTATCLDAPHPVHLTSPTAVTEAIEAFLAGIARG